MNIEKIWRNAAIVGASLLGVIILGEVGSALDNQTKVDVTKKWEEKYNQTKFIMNNIPEFVEAMNNIRKIGNGKYFGKVINYDSMANFLLEEVLDLQDYTKILERNNWKGFSYSRNYLFQ